MVFFLILIQVDFLIGPNGSATIDCSVDSILYYGKGVDNPVVF